jgi:hypothetical protein
LTGRVPFSTCDTVAVDTPANRATSAIVAMKPLLLLAAPPASERRRLLNND